MGEVKAAARGVYATPVAKKMALLKAAEKMICQPQTHLLEGVRPCIAITSAPGTL